MIISNRTLKILLLILVCIRSHVYADVHINVTAGLKSNQLISIIPFDSQKNTKIALNNIDVANIISNDLRNSGKFFPLSSLKFPEQINNISNISIEKWLNLGTNILVIGKINETDNRKYSIFYQLIDISNDSKKVILQNQYTVTSQWLRYAAHSISNDIFEKLTRIKGAFCTRIAYIVHNISNNEQYPYKLYIADYDGYNEILIHHSKEPLMSPSWSPSGNQLIYVTFTNHRSMLVTHDLKNGDIHQLISFSRHNGAPSFSPNGKKLAFALSKTGSLNLYIMDLLTKKIQQITNERNNNTEPSWFPDSNTLAYTSDRGGTPQIYKININDKSNSERLSWLNFCNQNAQVSADGKFIIMISRGNNVQNVTKLDLLTGKSHKLSDGILDDTPTLAPNDTMIIYNTSEGSESKLYLLSVNGNYKSHLQIHHKNIKFPAWSSYIE